MVDLEKVLRELKEKRRLLEEEIRLYEQMEKKRATDTPMPSTRRGALGQALLPVRGKT